MHEALHRTRETHPRAAVALSCCMRSILLALGIVSLGCGDSSGPDAGPDTSLDAGTDGSIDADTHPADVGPDVPPPMPPGPVSSGRCPGEPRCLEGNDGVLLAGMARVDISPNLDEFERYTDGDGNGKYDLGEAFEDTDGDGVYDGAWIAGFGLARAATEIHDPVYATALALRNGDITIAIVSLDVVGWFIEENDRIRELLGDADLDYLVVSATHTHEGPDTVGIWGPTLDETGVVPELQAAIRAGAARAVTEALAALEPANLEHVGFRLSDIDVDGDGTPDADVNRWIGDNRHPNVVDDEVRVMRFVRAGTSTEEPGSGETIGTFVNFAAHPEYTGSSNTALSSDYPYWMRTAIEEGIAEDDRFAPPAMGFGGVTLFVNGALGVQIGPNGIHLEDRAGTAIPRGSFDAAACLGTQLGSMVIAALRGELSASPPEVLEAGDLGFRAKRFYVLVENARYHLAGRLGVFQRELEFYDPERPIGRRNLPWVKTEVAVVDIGPASMLTVPGELDPAEFVGGYEMPCPYTPGGCDALIDESSELPPDLSMAPSGPFLRERLLDARDDVSSVWLLGCAQDYLGYFIPEFDFVLSRALPYIDEAPGDHYEETNAVGEAAWPLIRGVIEDLIRE